MYTIRYLSVPIYGQKFLNRIDFLDSFMDEENFFIISKMLELWPSPKNPLTNCKPFVGEDVEQIC